MWLSWLGTVPPAKRSPIQLPGRAHTWVAGLVPGQGAYRRQLTDVSLSHTSVSLLLFLPPFPSKIIIVIIIIIIIIIIIKPGSYKAQK